MAASTPNASPGRRAPEGHQAAMVRGAPGSTRRLGHRHELATRAHSRGACAYASNDP